MNWYGFCPKCHHPIYNKQNRCDHCGYNNHSWMWWIIAPVGIYFLGLILFGPGGSTDNNSKVSTETNSNYSLSPVYFDRYAPERATVHAEMTDWVLEQTPPPPEYDLPDNQR